MNGAFRTLADVARLCKISHSQYCPTTLATKDSLTKSTSHVFEYVTLATNSIKKSSSLGILRDVE